LSVIIAFIFGLTFSKKKHASFFAGFSPSMPDGALKMYRASHNKKGGRAHAADVLISSGKQITLGKSSNEVDPQILILYS